MEKIATDIYTFEELRKKGFAYVDKTDIIWPLVNESIGKQFFLARPRRFGKSLLVSTLRSLFEGRRDLFQGLAIEPKWDWSKSWPVIHLDLGSCQADTVEGLWRKIGGMLDFEAERLGVTLRKELTVSDQFRFLVTDVIAEHDRRAKAADPKASVEQVVLLVDEYDKPILGHLSSPDVTQFRNALKEFYSVIKTMEPKQRFTFITGISKFSKVSIFSDLNNLKDRTMTASEATLLGYTHDELKKFFPGALAHLGQKNGQDANWAFDEVVKWYDGYRFEENAEKVINPVSFGLCAEEGKFEDYWSKTAMTTFLVDALKKHPLNFSKIGIDQRTLDAYEPEHPQLVTLLYQTGYLTISGFRQMSGMRKYDLALPNREVENSFLTSVLPIYTGLPDDGLVNHQFAAAEALYDGDVEKFVKALRAFFANIPYDLTDRQNEQMWQAIVYVVLKLIGTAVTAEVKTNDGRIDMVCDAPSGIYLIEFKLDRSAEEALAQIDQNGYATKYHLAGKKVVKIGVSFSSEKRTITDVKIG